MPTSKPEHETDKIVRRKLSDQVLDRLCEMISGGKLKEGDFLPSERALMERFSVGRPAVREALQSLHTQGLITISHGERSRVNVLSADIVLDQSDQVARLLLDAVPANLEHLKQARRMFELGIVKTAAERATANDIGTLRELFAAQAEHLNSGSDIKRFIDADMRFHNGIANILENPVISAASTAMLRWLREYHITLLHWSGNEDITLREHSRIIERIEANDPAGAEDEMNKHLDRSLDLYAPRKNRN